MGEFVDKTKGHVNEAVGKAKQHSDDPATRIKGKAQQVKGAIKGALGDKI